MYLKVQVKKIYTLQLEWRVLRSSTYVISIILFPKCSIKFLFESRNPKQASIWHLKCSSSFSSLPCKNDIVLVQTEEKVRSAMNFWILFQIASTSNVFGTYLHILMLYVHKQQVLNHHYRQVRHFFVWVLARPQFQEQGTKPKASSCSFFGSFFITHA